jgi:hypothetical protein
MQMTPERMLEVCAVFAAITFTGAFVFGAW